jgi:hypothetical protein
MEQLKKGSLNYLKGPTDRSWGLTISLVCLIVMIFQRSLSPQFWGFGIGGFIIATTAIFWPERLSAMNRTWMRGSEQIAKFTNPVIMSAVFVLVLCPLALIYRTKKKLKTPEVADSQATETYWLARSQPTISRESLRRQF